MSFIRGKEKKDKTLHDIVGFSLNLAGALTGSKGKVRSQMGTIYCSYNSFYHKD